MESELLFKTKNIKFCAYLRLRNIHPIKVEKFDRGKGIYHYKMLQEDYDNLKLEFDKSKFIEYANCMDAIKDLAY